MAWDLLFSSDFGLFSVIVIAFTILIAIAFAFLFSKKMREDEQTTRK